MNRNTRYVNRWEGYYLDDMECRWCLHYQGRKRGCKLNECCCEDEKREARKHGRIKRKRGSVSWDG